MGRLVQQPAPPHSDRRHPAPRARDQLLRSTPAPTGGWSQRIEPPPIPERFTASLLKRWSEPQHPTRQSSPTWSRARTTPLPTPATTPSKENRETGFHL